MEKILSLHEKNGEIPTLLLHSCCAPCSSYCLSYLSNYFKITVFYYNPNISEVEEYQKRVEEQKRLIEEMPVKYPVTFLEGTYEPQRFFQMAKDLEKIPEGGERCTKCYRLRLEEAGKVAKELQMDYFTTTLSISPLKDAQRLNTIGKEVSDQVGVAYLFSDFKKKEGYKKSIALSQTYRLYRQDYCGCVYSKLERQENTSN